MREDRPVSNFAQTHIFAERSSRQFRQAMLLVSGDRQQAQIGLRVSVHFSPCVAGQSGSGK